MYLQQDMLCVCLLDLSNTQVRLVQHMESLSGIRRLVSENDNFVLITSTVFPLFVPAGTILFFKFSRKKYQAKQCQKVRVQFKGVYY